jgi:hypothetical protein
LFLFRGHNAGKRAARKSERAESRVMVNYLDLELISKLGMGALPEKGKL